jgi:hypothetical protein
VKRRRPVPQHMAHAPLPEAVAQAVAFIEREQLVDEAERYVIEAEEHGKGEAS